MPQPAHAHLAATLQLTTIQLRVADLDRSLAFYTNQLGFVAGHRTADIAELTTAARVPPLLTLTVGRGAPAPPRDAAGLFHA
ncbi:MAG: VOC family protein, partial [Opitutaceae bacterium]